MTQGLRLLVFDRTCRGPRRPIGLSHVWHTGSWLYHLLDRLDASFGASSWIEALDWLVEVRAGEPIAEIQFWGHGKWGCARVAEDVLDSDALEPGHQYHDRLQAIRERLAGPQALWWFRTCETLGCLPGHRFARLWTEFFDARVAGHSYVIGFYQSGLHSLAPGAEPAWPADEGLAAGTPDKPEQAQWSRRGAPNTINCLRGTIPDGW